MRTVPALLVVGVLTLTGCRATTDRTGAASAPSPSPSVSTSPSHVPEPVRAPRTRTCGAWSSPDNPTGKELTAEHGEIRDCLGVGSTWFVFQLGSTEQPGGVEEFPCATGQCAPSDMTFQESRWRYVAPPFSGGVTLLGWGKGQSMIVDDEGHELLFWPGTGLFTSESVRSSGPSADSSSANAPGACRHRDLATRWADAQVGAGSEGQWIAVTDVGASGCRLSVMRTPMSPMSSTPCAAPK